MEEQPLIIVPTRLERPHHLRLTLRAVSTIRGTCEVDPLVIDDGSPDSVLLAELQARDVEVWHGREQRGFAATVNAGLQKALEEGRDAVIVQADVELIEHGWLDALQARDGAVVGGMLLFENLLISQAGLYYSSLHRDYAIRFLYCPGNLKQANVATVCPVLPELMLIRNKALSQVGLFDTNFKFGGEGVDYCTRVFEEGLECWYEPKARAFHTGKEFTGPALAEWREESARYLHRKLGNSVVPEQVPLRLAA